MFCSPQATSKTGLSVSLGNTSQNMFIQSDKMVEMVVTEVTFLMTDAK
jgi:hypothetical protein